VIAYNFGRLLAAALLASLATVQAHAASIFSLSITYDTMANPALASTALTGSAQFYSVDPNVNDAIPNAVGNALNIGNLSLGSSFFKSFQPVDPCFGGSTCDIGLSFTGLSQGFTVYGFDTLPSSWPSSVLTSYFTSFAPVDPCINGSVCHASGVLVANDDPVQIGTWEVTISAETPLPGALPLFASGLGALGLLGWRRKRKQIV